MEVFILSKKDSKAMKKELVSRYYQGVKVKKLCEEYSVSKTSLYSWIKLFSWVKSLKGTCEGSPKRCSTNGV